MRRKWLLVIPLILIGVYFLGPHPARPVYNMALPAVPGESSALTTYINKKESMHRLKPDNQARIIWFNDSLKQKTEYAIVYLHGFSASQAEGEPVHRNIAKKYGCNLFLSRLAEHGIDTVDALANLKADEYWESAKEALVIGQQIGKKVILMGTSTGGTFALMLAAHYPDVHAIILLSPNIAINNPGAPLLNNPWGFQIASLVLPDKHVHSKDQREIFRQYWNSEYSVKAAIELEELLETSMNEATFKKVHQPVLNLYYYKDAVQQDSVVKVSAMKTMMQQLGTPERLKRSIAFPKAGTHVIGSYIRSGDVEGVQQAIDRFMSEILHLKPNTAGTGNRP
jgi:esterase/lipase